MKRISILVLTALALGACSESEAELTPNDIIWADGDSGVLDGEAFQLAYVDSPELGEAGTQDGANCAEELEAGLAAQAFMQELTTTAALEVTQRITTDPQGRTVIHLSADGVDVTETAIAAGHMAPWPFENGRPAAPKPVWCPAEAEAPAE